MVELAAKQAQRKRDRDEDYIVDLCDRVLKLKASRQHCFDFLRGDPGKQGQCAMLPVDAYYAPLRLVVEYRETQHYRPHKFFDRRQTVSGCGRGEQRKRYDQRKEEILPAHGIRLVVLRHDVFRQQGKKLLREAQDEVIVRSAMSVIIKT